MFISLAMRQAPQLVLIISFCLLSVVAAHSQTLTVSVTIDSQTTTIANAKILVKSTRGYYIGSSFQTFDGIFVTDAVIPPAGIELRPTLVEWNKIKEIEFIDWEFKPDTPETRAMPDYQRPRFCKGKLALSNGVVRDVFLWNAGNDNRYYSLSAGDIQIQGKLSLDSKEQDVQVTGRKSLSKLRFGSI